MTLRDIEIVAKNRARGHSAVWLCRIKTDPPPANYALWSFDGGRWEERGMSRRSAQEWCNQHGLNITLGE